MIGVVARFFGVNQFIVAAGLIAIAIASFWGWGSYNHFTGKSEGKRIERASWEEAVRILRKQMDEERRQAQLAIDQIERDYLAQRDSDLSAIQDLETIISEMEKEDADTPAPSRVFFPERLSKSIGQIGR